MEDEYFVAEGGRFVAVFDGHGGGGVSQFLKHHLYDAVCQHLRQGEDSESLASPPNETTNPALLSHNSAHQARRDRGAIPSVISHATALKTAFAQMEESVLVDETLNYQGSTAVAVYMHECNGQRTLLSANVGDSRAVLSRHGRAVDLTRDHKPNDERERARILAMGETIEWDRLSQVHRVRNLSLSRAIGDRFAKPVVSADVEINHFPVMEDTDEFILLASDGLWDAMTSEEVVSFVHQTIESELSSTNIAKDDISNYKRVLRRNMAKFVAREAIRRGSCDNVCVIMVWLNDMSQT
jgi:serine/threonine protein phosphatase PrpC